MPLFFVSGFLWLHRFNACGVSMFHVSKFLCFSFYVQSSIVQGFEGLRPFIVESWRAATVQCFRFNGYL